MSSIYVFHLLCDAWKSYSGHIEHIYCVCVAESWLIASVLEHVWGSLGSLIQSTYHI